MNKRLMELVEGLKRRRIFVSLIVTNTQVQVTYWDRSLHEMVTSDPAGARMHLNALDENDRREAEYAAGRMSRRRLFGW